ncbi:MAG: hypothetical protein J5I81_05705 [Nitrococcus mobilis]|nr:hypothetical protein [Nitrococcus mobilis]
MRFYAEHFGSVIEALASLNADGQGTLKTDRTQLWSDHNRATDGSIHVIGEILEVFATRA